MSSENSKLHKIVLTNEKLLKYKAIYDKNPAKAINTMQSDKENIGEQDIIDFLEFTDDAKARQAHKLQIIDLVDWFLDGVLSEIKEDLELKLKHHDSLPIIKKIQNIDRIYKRISPLLEQKKEQYDPTKTGGKKNIEKKHLRKKTYKTKTLKYKNGFNNSYRNRKTRSRIRASIRRSPF